MNDTIVSEIYERMATPSSGQPKCQEKLKLMVLGRYGTILVALFCGDLVAPTTPDSLSMMIRD